MSAADLDATTTRAIDRFLDDWLYEADVPGASVAVFDADGLRYATGLGARDLAETEPATPDTLYNVGSVTKPVTAIAVLQLVERDVLALEDAVCEYVPFLTDAPGDPITVRELLSHSSGVPSDAVVLRDNVADTRDLRRHVEGGADRRITEDPPFMYLNSGYKVLGELVGAVDGRSYPDYVEQEVLEPLGMDRSTFDQAVLWDDADAMTGYRAENDDRTPSEEPLEFETQPADGGLISSVRDLARLLRCLSQDGSLEGTRVLAPESVAAMTDRHAPWGSTVDGDEYWYGYGLRTEGFLGDRLVGHAGSTAHSMAYVGGLEERGLGVALAVNTTRVRVGDYGRGVLALAAGESPVEHVPGLSLREKLEAVAATYEAYRGPTATVEAADGHLAIELEEAEESLTAVPESLARDDYSFYAVRGDGRRDRIEFRETDAGLSMLLSQWRLDET